MSQVETWIRERAYAIWQEEGCPEGREQQHWERAAREVMNGGGAGSPTGKSAKSAAKSPPAQRGKTNRARKAA